MPYGFSPQDLLTRTLPALAILLALASPATARAAAGEAAAGEAAAVARGAYLAAAAGCAQCHTDKKGGGKPFAGGRVFATPYGQVSSPNITPDRKTGIGGWDRQDFVRAMRWGIAPDQSHYLPVFPFQYYNRLTRGDLADLWAFLASLAPVSRENAATPRPPLFGSARAAIAVVVSPAAGPWHAERTKSAAWNRGAYLVATVGRCGDCHTPRDLWGAPVPGRFLAGVAASGTTKKTPNITPDARTGIGNWSLDDIATLLAIGQTPDFDFVGGAMGEIVKNTAHLSGADRRAIAVYLRALPPEVLEKKG